MNAIERMVAAGMTLECAADTAMWYMAQGDDEGLETYVSGLEALKNMDNKRGTQVLQP